MTFQGVDGIKHSVDVTAGAVVEAAALGVSLLRPGQLVGCHRPGTSIDVRATQPATTHSIALIQIRRWCDGVGVRPEEIRSGGKRNSSWRAE